MSSLIAANSSHQLNSIDEHRYHRSRQAHDVTMTNEDSSLSGTPRTSATHRSRPMPTSYSFWLNTGDNNNQTNASFMRSTYAASCRARLSRSVERCPRACRGILDDVSRLAITSVCAWASSYHLSLCVRVCRLLCFDLNDSLFHIHDSFIICCLLIFSSWRSIE